MRTNVLKHYESIQNSKLELRIDLYYSLGGMNYFNSKNEKRGYYLSVSPVQREFKENYISETYTSFSGTKMLLLECKRQSNKAYNEALKNYPESLERLKEYVLKSNNL